MQYKSEKLITVDEIQFSDFPVFTSTSDICQNLRTQFVLSDVILVLIRLYENKSVDFLSPVAKTGHAHKPTSLASDWPKVNFNMKIDQSRV